MESPQTYGRDPTTERHFRNLHQVIAVVKNRAAAFAALGHGGPIFKQAGILT